MSKSVQTMPFKGVLSLVLSSGTNRFNVYPTNFPRLLSVADNWKLYRFTTFRFRLKTAASGSSSAVYIAAYSPSVMDTTPAFVDVNEFVISTSLSATAHVDSDWCSVPRAVLKGPLEWYWAIPGTATNVEEIQGTIALVGANAADASTQYIEIDGTIEFSGVTDPGSTPEIRARKHMIAEKERLMRILSYSPETQGSPAVLPGTRPGKP